MKNIKIPRKKKKKQNNQSLYQESQDYKPDMNSLKQSSRRTESNDEEQCMENL